MRGVYEIRCEVYTKFGAPKNINLRDVRGIMHNLQPWKTYCQKWYFRSKLKSWPWYFLGIKHGQTDNSGFCRGNPGLNLHPFRIFLFVYRWLSIKLGDMFGCREAELIYPVATKFFGLTPYAYVLSAPPPWGIFLCSIYFWFLRVNSHCTLAGAPIIVRKK